MCLHPPNLAVLNRKQKKTIRSQRSIAFQSLKPCEIVLGRSCCIKGTRFIKTAIFRYLARSIARHSTSALEMRSIVISMVMSKQNSKRLEDCLQKINPSAPESVRQCQEKLLTVHCLEKIPTLLVKRFIQQIQLNRCLRNRHGHSGI
jgi:hypothetical protein